MDRAGASYPPFLCRDVASSRIGQAATSGNPAFGQKNDPR